jgi:regulator of protease activity HflC (stomatin/prohibitin superfamily)
MIAGMADIIVGVLVEIFVAVVALSVTYRLLAGRFLVPKREIIPPFHHGVIYRGDHPVRVCKSGSCWLRAGQRVVTSDMRPRPLQMLNNDVIGSDNGIVRLSVNGEYRVTDPIQYQSASMKSADALYVLLRKVLSSSARMQQSSVITSAPTALSEQAAVLIKPHAEKLGLELSHCDIWEAIPMGWVRSNGEDDPSEPTLVH